MAKTEKVKNRKLRRRVRRTSAIILLITSIIVAAIPVPENAAAPGDPTPAAPDRNEDDYTYDVDAVADSMIQAMASLLLKGMPENMKHIWWLRVVELISINGSLNIF